MVSTTNSSNRSAAGENEMDCGCKRGQGPRRMSGVSQAERDAFGGKEWSTMKRNENVGGEIGPRTNRAASEGWMHT